MDDDDALARSARPRGAVTVVQDTALAARDSGGMLPPPRPQDVAADRRASVVSQSSIPPVPVDMIAANLPNETRMQ